MKKPVVAIVGGGVIGLSIGWRLTQQGIPTLVFEKGEVGCEASSAAAGMITPVSELRFGEEDLLSLFLESLGLYPEFVSQLEKESGSSVDFNRNGSYLIAIDPDDEAELSRIHDYQKSLDLPVSFVSPSEVIAHEPLLSTHFHAALEAKGECFLDNRLLIGALKKALIQNGGRIFEHTVVQKLDTHEKRVRGVIVDGGPIAANRVVLAAGIHTDLEGLPDGEPLPVRPVKGQAFELKIGKSGINPLKRAIRTIHRYPVYLVPRSDGRMIVGATNEEMGGDARVTGGALLDLLSGAWKILPAIEEMEFVRAWTGHRAATPDHAPVLGPSGLEGLHYAMGFYRHGFLVAPVVAKLISEAIAFEKESPLYDRFSWKRFSRTSISKFPLPRGERVERQVG